MSSEDTDTDHYQGALLEEMNDRLKVLLEAQDTLAKASDVTRLQIDIKADISIIKTILKARSTDIGDHEKRITNLETQTAA
jgi:wobble nucleotide-excising tRNase